MKKSTVNILLIAGAAAAAWFIFTSMRRKPKSSVEAGPTEKITEQQYEEAEVVTETPKPELIKTGQSVLSVIKSLKRTPAAKEAAKKRKALKKQPKAAAAIKTFLSAPRAVRGIDNDLPVLY